MSAPRKYQPGHNQDYYGQGGQPQPGYGPQQNSYYAPHGQQQQNQWTAPPGPQNEFPGPGESPAENQLNAGEGERGLGGALAGGLAGGFTGHKLNHGFLGSFGGAIIGSLIEDQLKKHGGREHDDHRHHHQDHHRQQQQQASNLLPGQVLSTLTGAANASTASLHHCKK
ncbi:hypothetical protein VTN96DRAFT_7029 [Rasamsonia emersonii]|uniref:Glycine zipper 2TM domain-containing protein n=1 Tax=Rasamsonia emersonii (strain ATCC 16479 / CBS 393.64 / IMI 116815) TaxID=1408163 RepID=A0A0F4YXD8_RASE3|nr:hypothetical protein T310_3713 [Rasamsonia emersonii CBS 393.64]KKA22278.1 hypothetical protein T310_3713 [Rasamsonia emersonii CBS 393.64]